MTDIDMTPVPPTISWGDIIPLTSDDWKDLPDVRTPYYAEGTEGYYLHQRTDAGRWLTKVNRKPPRLKPVGNWYGMGQFDGKQIPADIYAQAVHFFRRIWAEHQTEAEVLITQHQTTKDYRLYVPTQRVSHGGVYSYHNPKTIDRNYLVVGTFHSHCNFSAYHSSTDEGDARDMDGIHGTVGYVDRDEPELALMVASNGVLFHFKDDMADLVDTSDLSAGTAPAWWDRYMVFGKVTDADRPDWIDDISWDKYMGRYKKPVQIYQPTTPPATKGPTPAQKSWRETAGGFFRRDNTNTNDEIDWVDAQLHEMMLANGYRYDTTTHSYRVAELNESQEFNQRLLGPGGAPNPDWDSDGALLPGERVHTDWIAKEGEDDYWETALGRYYVDGLMTSGLFSEEDLELAIDNYPESGTREFWTKWMLEKATWIAEWFQAYEDREMTFSLKASDKIKPVPGQTTVDEALTGAIQ